MGGGGSKQSKKDAEVSDFKRDEVAFGETSAAPPKVNLKRRHWDAEQTEAAHKSRNKDMMLKYMKAADQRVTKSDATATVQLRRKVRQHALLNITDAHEKYHTSKYLW